jgi:hypothetical protein
MIRRCSPCGLSWPDDPRYADCPQCEQETQRMSGGKPMSPEEAEHLRKYAAFDRHYARHCAELGIPVEGPLY